ncbi:zinc-dependent alcohol dehydrogenase family protein [Alkalihalobacillus sp. BA299]|uniref:zinc-dependent alcohol dehydrogenase family protein n=1 Tax=Alkalihalobacillus sp. BA299 TaxID=2815938 RepID=UPI001ADC3F59|nr:zinc-dependent alcohol dehydrogenase family protein [Alkalihalobacillus sp. BA299]
MKAVYYSAPEKFSVKPVTKPVIQENQVLIEVTSCGVCKTDAHIHQGEFIANFPLIPGHEFVGKIVEVGSAVTSLSVGERVAADNTVLCGHCYYCQRNQPLYCENFYSLGVTGPGGFAEFVAVNADKVFPIGNLHFDEAIFIEPTACAIHGTDVVDVQTGDDVVIFGAGPTGLIMAQLLKYSGAGNLVVVASDPNKLELAKELGADYTILMDRNNYSAHEDELKKLLPKGFDIVVDATGAPVVMQTLTKHTKHGAKVVIYGVASEEDTITVSPYEIFSKELKIIGSFAQTHCFDRAIKVIKNGIVDVKKMITHRFSLDEFGKAMQQVDSGKGHIKVVIDCKEN